MNNPVGRENVISAGNQQERLIEIGWVIGFVDGEGCFSIGFVNQNDRQEPSRIRRGYTTGYQVNHKFAVTQGEKSLKSLVRLKRYCGVGNIYINRRHDNHKEHLYNYSVQNREDLRTVIIPFFQKYPLRTAKNNDFKKFVQVMEIVNHNQHKDPIGLIKIVNIAKTMNRQKPRESIIRILRDHAPTSMKVDKI